MPENPPSDKVAPWKKWTAIKLSATNSTSGTKYPVQFRVAAFDDKTNARYSKLISSAADQYFKVREPPGDGEGPAAYLVETRATDKRRLLRVVYRELVVQFKPDVAWDKRNAILEKVGFRTVERSRFDRNQWIVRHVEPGTAGESLLAAADAFEPVKEVEFAWPNSLAEYVRSNPLPRDWWLQNMNVTHPDGSRLDPGDPNVVIAVLDDGVHFKVACHRSIHHLCRFGRVCFGLTGYKVS